MGILKHIPEQITDRVPKVYFSCHKDDFDLYFKEISAEIKNGRNCAVFYDADYDGVRDEQFLFDLSQMNLFVMPITTRLLTKPNRALGEELAFAIEHKIPVLPLMQESELEELYNQKFGDLQFLDKNSQEPGAISYEEKLDKYLSSILLNDETIKRIRGEFDAQIFLSYRKKDRIHANRLMRLIHKNDFCRDIAIWYDEFLTPGENFNDNIRKALDKSGLFVLAVTPSLLEPRIDEEGIEHKNYIEEHEYPMAKDREREGKIAILPAELVKTDSVLLSQKYENIPDCVDSDDENALTEALLNTAKKLVNDENDNSPEHNYLIGLAYLNGIDVEVDHARAVDMIEFAANADYLEAIDKMIEMYSNGIGTERNYETAIQWRERKITLLQKRYNENPNEYNANSLFWALIYCGDEYRALDRRDSLYVSEIKYKSANALEIYEARYNPSNNTKRNIAISYSRLGRTYGAKAKDYYEKAHAIFEQLAKETGTVEARLDLAQSYDDLGLTYNFEGNFAKSRKYRETALAMREQLAKETGTIEARRDLAKSLIACSGKRGTKREKAKKIKFEKKALAIREQLAEETGTVEARRDLAASYQRVGSIYESDGKTAEAKKYYKKALIILEQLAAETGRVGVKESLASSYSQQGRIYKSEGNIAEAKKYYEKSLVIREQLAIETGSSRRCFGLDRSYKTLQSIYELDGDLSKAKEYSEKSVIIVDLLLEEISEEEAFYKIATSYCNMSFVCQGEEKRSYLIKALNIMNALCEQYPDIARYKEHRDIIQSELDSLDEEEDESE